MIINLNLYNIYIKFRTFTNHHIKTLSDKLGNLKNLEEL